MANINLHIPELWSIHNNMIMTTKEFRRAYLEKALKICGTAEELANRTGINPQYISLMRNSVREVGHKSARSIEIGMGWDEGAMDRPPPGEGGSVEITHLFKTLPEQTSVDAVISSLPELSDAGIQKLTTALLRRLNSPEDS